MPNRRDFLRSLGSGIAGLAAVGPRTASAALGAEIRSLEVISKQPDVYHGWPTLARRRNGELLLVCSGGREDHVCPFGRVELMRSRDGGRTWSWPEVLLDTAIDDRDAGVCETARGSLLVTTFTSLAYEPILEKAEGKRQGASDAWPAHTLQRWQAVHARLDSASRKQLLGTWMLRSEDGLTWSAPFRCPVNSPHGPVALADGRLLYAGKELWTEAQRNGVCESTDDGKTWRWLADIPTRDGDDHREYHELHLVEADRRRLVAQIRNHNKANERETLQTESVDGGKSWTEPHSIGVWGMPSHLMRLRDGRLLMTYGYRREPYGNQIRVSEDQGRTWTEPIVLSSDGASRDLGYPSTVQIDDGSLVTVWYELLADSPRAVLRQARWSFSG
jgi:Neuraminidase (sialidase)